MAGIISFIWLLVLVRSSSIYPNEVNNVAWDGLVQCSKPFTRTPSLSLCTTVNNDQGSRMVNVDYLLLDGCCLGLGKLGEPSQEKMAGEDLVSTTPTCIDSNASFVWSETKDERSFCRLCSTYQQPGEFEETVCTYGSGCGSVCARPSVASHSVSSKYFLLLPGRQPSGRYSSPTRRRTNDLGAYDVSGGVKDLRRTHVTTLEPPPAASSRLLAAAAPLALSLSTSTIDPATTSHHCKPNSPYCPHAIFNVS